MKIEEELKSLLKSTFKSEIFSISALPISGSARKYFRIKDAERSVIGVYSKEIRENEAFFSFTSHFKNLGLNVPELIAIDTTRTYYLLQDLGDETLFSMLSKTSYKGNVSEEIIKLYKAALKELIRFQILGIQGIDSLKCYPRDSFDRQSMQWDLNYFKYYFLKFNDVTFDEQLIEDDFNRLIEFLLEENSNYFMVRDFQSRNIMIMNHKPYFIDYQGGRKGPLQYDLASLLFQAKANLSSDLRFELLDYYLKELKSVIRVDDVKFIQYYYGFVLIRMLQVLGAYGYRGLYERKPHFIESIDYAIQNLEWFLKEIVLKIELPALNKCLNDLVKLNKNGKKKG